ncbi:beta-lactamase family protein [Pedobacter sp. PAMC26386]|nr:beta-lactamase family protein [Pedobacter sp. PAMC26386]
MSKCVFAVLVLKLVEQGKIDLDKPLQDYLPRPIYEYKKQRRWHDDYSSLKGDILFSKITARICLDHTSGFPNWRWDMPDEKLKVIQQPGKRYSYSGESMFKELLELTIADKFTPRKWERYFPYQDL